jgi:hypothetical protein
MLSYARNYFRNCRIARMSNGEYCLIRDQGLVKGGRGLKCHETLMVFSVRGIAAKVRQSRKASAIRARDSLLGRCLARLGRGLQPDSTQLKQTPARSMSGRGHSHRAG